MQRLSAPARAWWHARVALHRERAALEQLGAALVRALPSGGAAREPVGSAIAAVVRHDDAIEGLRHGLGASLQQDRADYAVARSWLRPIVVLRGIATRCLIHDRIRVARHGRRAACRALGRVVIDERADVAGVVPHAVDAAAARARAVAAVAEHETELARLRSAPLASVAVHAYRESSALGRPLVTELRGRLFPRLPALAGLAVGWWIASTFTDSSLAGMLHSLGLGSGPRRVVSTQQLRAMEFWLPILAAAFCSYASSRIAALVRARYAPATGSSAAPRAAHEQGDARR